VIHDRYPVLVDCDGVLSDFTECCLRIARDAFGREHTETEITQWDTEKALGIPGLFAELEREIDRGLCRNMPALPGARDFMTELERMYGESNVLVVTSPWNATWLPQRAAWLTEFGVPEARQIQTKAPKRHVTGFLIDDGPHNLLDRHEFDRFCIDRPWNRDVPGPRGGYAECLAYLREAKRLPLKPR
jgi:5'(3')-deoxyribonucleotidase